MRLPKDSAKRAFRCPICKTALALTVDAKVLSARQLQAGDPGATCPICQTGIQADEFVVTCPKYDQVHHRECWSELAAAAPTAASRLRPSTNPTPRRKRRYRLGTKRLAGVEQNLDRLPLDPASLLVEEPEETQPPSPSSAPSPRPRSVTPRTAPTNVPASDSRHEASAPVVRTVSCPGCGTSYRLNLNPKIRRARCKNCQTVFELPTDG